MVSTTLGVVPIVIVAVGVKSGGVVLVDIVLAGGAVVSIAVVVSSVLRVRWSITYLTAINIAANGMRQQEAL